MKSQNKTFYSTGKINDTRSHWIIDYKNNVKDGFIKRYSLKNGTVKLIANWLANVL